MVLEIHEMTVQLQASLEDCIEMAEENRDDTSDETGDGKHVNCPNIGICFMDLAEVISIILFHELQVTKYFVTKISLQQLEVLQNQK